MKFFLAILLLLHRANGFTSSLTGLVKSPMLALYPNSWQEGISLIKGDSVTANLIFTLDLLGLEVPIQFGLWSHEELLGIETKNNLDEEHTPLNEDTIAEHCDITSNLVNSHYLPQSQSRIKTMILLPNITENIQWNYTIEVGGKYYFGLSSCSSHRTIAASGDLRWGRGAGGKDGSLPSTMLGIVPFYGVLTGLYFLMSVVWTIRVITYWQFTLNLHLTLFVALLANLIYATLAFGYYLHIDVDTAVTAEQVFGGIYQGFYRVNDPLAMIVATFRFLLMSSSETLLTFLADGLFVTREGLRKRSKAAAGILVGGQIMLILFQQQMWGVNEWLCGALNVILMGLWAGWLAITIFFTWRTLKAEDEAEALADLNSNVSDGVGESLSLNLRWAIPLKQRVFTMVWRAVLLYPILVALVSILFLVLSESFTWMWIRLVVVDVWMLFVLGPAAYHWLPYHSDTAQYGPLAQELPAAASVMEMASVTFEDRKAMIKALTSMDGGRSGSGIPLSSSSSSSSISLSSTLADDTYLKRSDHWSDDIDEEESDEESQMIV
mmetsp:Transcript_28823/g.34005  ORF Transcript_28823/g.34005 Transcript_28823/m.34005 type:complete len:551 (+) Transcript_28823:121-1773(+)